MHSYSAQDFCISVKHCNPYWFCCSFGRLIAATDKKKQKAKQLNCPLLKRMDKYLTVQFTQKFKLYIYTNAVMVKRIYCPSLQREEGN